MANSADDVLITAELASRPSRAPDRAAENAALIELAGLMAADPSAVLQRVAERVLHLCNADSSGVSILESGAEPPLLRWHATAGAFVDCVNGTIARDASPCGLVIERNEILLFRDPARLFPALRRVVPRIHECLIAPWHFDGRTIGTLWAIKHAPDGRLDAEDARLLTNLARLAAASYQTLQARADAQRAREELERRVAERTHAMQALRESEQRFRLIAENVLAGQFVWDLATMLVTLPKTTLELFEFDEGPVHSDRIFERIHPDDVAAVRAGVEPALEPGSGGMMRATYRVVRSDGSVRWVDSVGQVQFELHDAGEARAVRAFGVIWEVTEHKRLLEALQEADRRKDEFLAMLAHELRNPLAPIVNGLRLLERTEPMSAGGQRCLGMIDRQVRQMKRLVDDLLEVSRISRGTIELKREPMLLGAAIQNAIEAALPAFDAKGQELEVALPPRPIRLFADPVRIGQVLENLLSNACKYTPRGGRVRVGVDVNDAADSVEIRISDNGIGIAPDKLERIFELFVQAVPGVGEYQGGLGIGLSMVRRLVELHGGSVHALSAGRDQGATFVVHLPRTASITTSTAPAAPPGA